MSEKKVVELDDERRAAMVSNLMERLKAPAPRKRGRPPKV